MAKKLESDGSYKDILDSQNKTGVIKNNPSDKPSEIKTVADSATSSNADDVRGRGTAKGDPRMRKGKKVSIIGVSKKFSGDYTLVEVTHTISSKGYVVDFTTGDNKNDVAKGPSKTVDKKNGSGSNKPQAPSTDDKNGWKLGTDGKYKKG